MVTDSGAITIQTRHRTRPVIKKQWLRGIVTSLSTTTVLSMKISINTRPSKYDKASKWLRIPAMLRPSSAMEIVTTLSVNTIMHRLPQKIGVAF